MSPSQLEAVVQMPLYKHWAAVAAGFLRLSGWQLKYCQIAPAATSNIKKPKKQGALRRYWSMNTQTWKMG